MTAGTLKTLAEFYAKATGQRYITADADVYSLMSDRLLSLSVWSKTLYDDAIDFTPVANQRNYPYITASAVFKIAGTNRALVKVTNVIINGSSLRDSFGRVGPTTQDDMSVIEPEYVTSAAGVPIRWWTSKPGTLHLWPKPTAAVVADAENYVQGWWKHPAVAATGDTVYFSDEDKEFLAKDIAANLIAPYAEPDSAGFAKMMSLRADVDAWLTGRKAEAEQRTMTPSIRGYSQTDFNAYLGDG